MISKKSTDSKIFSEKDLDQSTGFIKNNLSDKKIKFFEDIENIIMTRPEEEKIGFVCRSLVAASMPYTKVSTLQYKRINNKFTLTIQGNQEAGGIPYGIYPRLILSWLSTEIVRTQSREIMLGSSLSSFMKNLGLGVTGGRWGTITRFKEQLKRLFSAHISLTYEDKDRGRWVSTNISIADQAEIFWDPSTSDKLDIFKSKIRLGELFFNEVIKSPVPIDIRVINLIKDSSLALDIYFWLTYRLSYLKLPLHLSYENLQMQFGGDYAHTSQGQYEFKRKFITQLKKVNSIYTDARIKIDEKGILLTPSSPHIAKS